MAIRRPRALRRDDRGAVAVEYALLGAFVGLGLVATLVSAKASLNTTYSCLCRLAQHLDGLWPDPGRPVALGDPVLPARRAAQSRRRHRGDGRSDPGRVGQHRRQPAAVARIDDGAQCRRDVFPPQPVQRRRQLHGLSALEQGSNVYVETYPGSKTYYNDSNNGLMLYKADDGTWYGTITKSKT